MNTLKALRPPSSRPSSPAPMGPAHSEPGMTLEAPHPMSRTSSKSGLNRLALSNFKRSAPVPTPPATPPLVQDGSYLAALSLKWSEAVSKALLLPTGVSPAGEVLLKGKRALPTGRGATLGALIASELESAGSNQHLYKAIVRSLHRPLSVLLTNLSAQLLPLLSSPSFTAHPTPSVPNATQLHALSYATFTAELLEAFDRLGLGQVDYAGQDNMRAIREGFESQIGRIVNPIISGIKNELIPLVENLEQQAPQASAIATHTKSPAAQKNLHPSVTVLQHLIPLHIRTLTRCTTPPTSTSQTAVASLVISLIWRSLVSLSHRTPPARTQAPVATPPSPPQTATTRKKRIGSSTTPPTTPPTSRFTMKLPPSRPPSPPAPSVPVPFMDAKALYEVFNLLPRPGTDTRFALAQEAVGEAFDALSALCALLDAEASCEHVADIGTLTEDLPTVIALPVLLRWIGPSSCTDDGDKIAGLVPDLLGVTESDYRAGCLGGFGRAEEYGTQVAERVRNALSTKEVGQSQLTRWLDERVASGE